MKSLLKRIFARRIKHARNVPYEDVFKRSGKERREHTRVPSRNLVKYFSKAEMGISNVYDISEGGLCMRVTQRFQKKMAIETTLNLREPDMQIGGLGEVAWVSKGRGAQPRFYHVGVSFTDITEENRLKIKDFINHKCEGLDRRSA